MSRHTRSCWLACEGTTLILAGGVTAVHGAVIAQRVVADSDLELGADDPPPDGQNSPGDGPLLVGIRWTDLNIPPGATITNAYVQFAVNEEDKSFAFPGEDGSSVLVIAAMSIVGELDPNPATYEAVPFNISDRPETASRVQWNNIPDWWPIGGPPPVDPEGPDQRTHDVSLINQELVDQPGWA